LKFSNDAVFATDEGGMSGRPLFPRATRMLARVFRLAEGKIPLIGVGGIDSGESALAKIEAGASLLQLYTGLVFEGPSLIGRIKQALLAAMAKERYAQLTPLIGAGPRTGRNGGFSHDGHHLLQAHGFLLVTGHLHLPAF
jgi:dihydroorotate dehydrogenase